MMSYVKCRIYPLDFTFLCPPPPPHDSKVHGANMGSTWVLSVPDGPRVGHMNLAIRALMGPGNDIPRRSTQPTNQPTNQTWNTVIVMKSFKKKQSSAIGHNVGDAY